MYGKILLTKEFLREDPTEHSKKEDDEALCIKR